MSLAFSDTTNKDGIIQGIEQALFGSDGDARISGNTNLLAIFTGMINQAHDDAFQIIFDADGTWQFDDSNHTDYPIITTNIVSGQRDYPFTTDGNSNLILEIHRVLVADSGGTFTDIQPSDAQTENDTTGFWDGQNTQGNPVYYDKTANAIFLDPVPNYNYTNGLKLYVTREGSYFTTSDTTKKPGIAGFLHEYYVVNPAYKYAYRNGLANKNDLLSEKLRIEDQIRSYYGRRNEDVRSRMEPAAQDNA
jgi:hypothetical protein